MKEFEFNERVMGTDLSIALVTPSEAEAATIFNESYAALCTYEAQFSRFIPTSELSLLNLERSRRVSPFFIALLTRAHDLYTETHGYFNPLVQIERFGYTKTYEALKDGAHTQDSTPYNIDFDAVVIDEDTLTVTLIEDQKLDFGGFLKGHLAEVEAKRIMATYPTVTGVIVNIGGDIHTRGFDEHGHAFVFEIENPCTGIPLTIPLTNTSLATSGTYTRTWEASGTLMHHILARDGTHNPDTHVISASIIHPHGAYAEAFAKTLLMLEPDALTLLTRENMRYTLTYQDGTTRSSL
jgi:thiamine biosynthesis lipoprotein